MTLFRTNSDQSMKLSSIATSDTSNDTERSPSIETHVCLIDDANTNENFKNLKALNLSIVTSKDGHEYLNDDDDSHYETIFIISNFERNIFHELKQTLIRILGPPVIAAAVQTNKPLPYNSQPLYCTCMQGLNLCFTNFETKEHLSQLVVLCHNMGACIRKDMTSKIDFLNTNSLYGPK